MTRTLTAMQTSGASELLVGRGSCARFEDSKVQGSSLLAIHPWTNYPKAGAVTV